MHDEHMGFLKIRGNRKKIAKVRSMETAVRRSVCSTSVCHEAEKLPARCIALENHSFAVMEEGSLTKAENCDCMVCRSSAE